MCPFLFVLIEWNHHKGGKKNMKRYLHGQKFFLANEVKGAGYLDITGGQFGAYQVDKPTEGEIIEYGEQWIAPGLVDTHIHGLLGHDVMDGDFEGLNEISKGLLACGVTSFLPTTLTASTEQLNEVVAMIGEGQAKVEGAKIAGIYLEGPFFTEKHKGAQNTAYFSDPEIKTLENWQKLSNGLIKKIALAPEREGVPAFVKKATEEGIVVALGHSDATYDQAKAAVEAGASVFVHTYNGMSPLNHREPGMVGAAMSLPDVFAELICDGHHVHPVAAEILMDVRGRDHTALITDCMRAGSMSDGDYTLGEFPVIVKDGMAKLHSGSLAGSVLKLKEAIKNVVDWGIATPAEAIQMATTVPAVSCKIADVCGEISPGRAADFIVLNPNMSLQATFLDGTCRFEK